MTTSQPASTRETALNPNVVVGVLLTVVLTGIIMGLFALNHRIDTRFDKLDTKIDTRFDKLDNKLDQLTELLLSGKIKVTAP